MWVQLEREEREQDFEREQERQRSVLEEQRREVIGAGGGGRYGGRYREEGVKTYNESRRCAVN